MNVNPRRPLFNRKPQSNIYRMFLWVVMILGGVWMLQQIDRGDIKPLFQATAVPTRSVESYLMEGDADFDAGKLDAAILAYQEALEMNPNDAQTWWKLARIQTYSSAFLITDPDKKARLLEALASARKAVGLAPDESKAHAILAFTLDWNADKSIYKDDPHQAEAFLAEAEAEALQAQQLDNTDISALAYYAEILVDEQKWNQAELIINQALEQPNADQEMDVHRVNAYVLETLGDYNLAITEYEKAIAIEPNFTFLYLRIGANYRRLAFDLQTRQGTEAARPVYEKSLEYFDKAVKINKQIGVDDPGPHLSIARTYSQLGEFFIAAKNVQTALKYQPTNADIYGQLGIIFFKSRNYEGSIDTLKCAIYGCSGEASCLGRGLDKCYPDLDEKPANVQGLAISPSTIVYYYTYGSVQAALSRKSDNRCEEALRVLNQVRNEVDQHPDLYADGRDTIIKIIQDGEFICQSLAEGNASPDGTAPTEASTETSGGTYEATATSAP
ncbi:MAG TPA: tetratricopeptide repeat protein [Anaerolineales bacterium]|nr:tetratricopeptide repeat protein [Anaerolineales bacterium]